jgi:hypothetical protein
VEVRTRDLGVAAGFAALLVFGSPFVGQARASASAAFPGAVGPAAAVVIAAFVGAWILIALTRIRHHRAERYLAIASAVLVAAIFSRSFRTGNAEIDLVEAFHFVEYGALTFLFYRAWHARGDGSSLALPALAGLLVAACDEWFQWFVPGRVGELRDLAIDAAAVMCGLLFSIGLRPPIRVTLALGAGSPMRIGSLAAVAVLTLALFFQTAFLGYEVTDPAVGTFRSRYTAEQLGEASRRRAAQWRDRAPLEQGLVSREDQYLSEGLWHVARRNDAATTGDMRGAWQENLILETFYAPVLDIPSSASGVAHRWPAEQRASTARADGAERGAYRSDAEPYPLYAWPKPLFWLAIALAIAALAGASLSADARTDASTRGPVEISCRSRGLWYSALGALELPRRRRGKKSEEVQQETERGIHEADDAQRGARRGRRHETAAAHRGHEEAVGVHQTERSAGQEEQTDDQG